MITITATRNTYLKKEPVNSNLLPTYQLLPVNKGKKYAVQSLSRSSHGHSVVVLSYGAGTWYIFDDHWDVKEDGSDDFPVEGVELIKEFEGLELTSYPDPLSGGRPYTIGYGNTRDRRGMAIPPNMKITEKEAEELLIHTINADFLPVLTRTIPYWEEMNRFQKGAILSFAYNLGAHFFGMSGFRTISRVLKNRDYGNIRSALLLYVNPESNVEQGLRRRRHAEADLFERTP